MTTLIQGMAQVENISNSECWPGCETTWTLIADKNAKWYSNFRRQFGGFSEN